MKTASICGIAGSAMLLCLDIFQSIGIGGLYNFDDYLPPIVMLVFTYSFHKRLTHPKA